jgi:hypothetical protein
MATTNDAELRELDRRSGDGIKVTLLWEPRTNRVFVDVDDQRDGWSFRIAVEPSAAADAFRHPYAYTGHRDLDELPLAA